MLKCLLIREKKQKKKEGEEEERSEKREMDSKQWNGRKGKIGDYAQACAARVWHTDAQRPTSSITSNRSAMAYTRCFRCLAI